MSASNAQPTQAAPRAKRAGPGARERHERKVMQAVDAFKSAGACGAPADQVAARVKAAENYLAAIAGLPDSVFAGLP